MAESDDRLHDTACPKPARDAARGNRMHLLAIAHPAKAVAAAADNAMQPRAIGSSAAVLADDASRHPTIGHRQTSDVVAAAAASRHPTTGPKRSVLAAAASRHRDANNCSNRFARCALRDSANSAPRQKRNVHRNSRAGYRRTNMTNTKTSEQNRGSFGWKMSALGVAVHNSRMNTCGYRDTRDDSQSPPAHTTVRSTERYRSCGDPACSVVIRIPVPSYALNPQLACAFPLCSPDMFNSGLSHDFPTNKSSVTETHIIRADVSVTMMKTSSHVNDCLHLQDEGRVATSAARRLPPNASRAFRSCNTGQSRCRLVAGIYPGPRCTADPSTRSGRLG